MSHATLGVGGGGAIRYSILGIGEKREHTLHTVKSEEIIFESQSLKFDYCWRTSAHTRGRWAERKKENWGSQEKERGEMEGKMIHFWQWVWWKWEQWFVGMAPAKGDDGDLEKWLKTRGDSEWLGEEEECFQGSALLSFLLLVVLVNRATFTNWNIRSDRSGCFENGPTKEPDEWHFFLTTD